MNQHKQLVGLLCCLLGAGDAWAGLNSIQPPEHSKLCSPKTCDEIVSQFVHGTWPI
jgi:hypothetical protein